MSIQERINAFNNQLKQLQHARLIAETREEIKRIDIQIDSIHAQLESLYNSI